MVGSSGRPGGDLTNLWRLAFWGMSAAFALLVAAYAGLSEEGFRRIMIALNANKTPPAAVTVAAPQPSESPLAVAERQRLLAAIEALTSDQRRLLSRISALERGIEDMTGSIQRLPERTRSAPAAEAPPPPPPPAIAVPKPAESPPPASPPKRAEPVAAPPKPPETASIPSPVVPAPSPPPVTPNAAPVSPIGVLTRPPAESPAGGIPRVGLPLVIGPTSTAKSERLTAWPPLARVRKVEIGIDVGGASSIAGFKALWKSTRDAHAEPLKTLHPRIALRDNPRAGGLQPRLVLGPLDNPQDATLLCMRLAQAGRYCRPASFDGQPLSVED